jgi:23S rRNA (cytosine1962-C5)-methyltransferase
MSHLCMSLPEVFLKPGKDVPVRAGHPWIFSEAIAVDPHGAPGELVDVFDHKHSFLGRGTYNPLTSIRVRLLTRKAEPIDAAFFEHRFRALDTWKKAHLPPETTGYRLVHAEADGLPGLIVDRFADTFVFQLHTAGADNLREPIVEALERVFSPCAIVERSDVDVRTREGLSSRPIVTHRGEVSAPVSFQETGLTFVADVLRGQKTGFFLDQRDARRAVGRFARGKRVLNLFGYTGAFSVHAAHGGAAFVATVDVSRPALELTEKHLRLNGFDPSDETRFLQLEADVLDLLQDPEIPHAPYDVIICDPPAFAKSERHLEQAIKAYTQINIDCLRALKPGGILVTCSCSGRLSPEEFRSLLRIAAGRAGKEVRILETLGHPVDHAERLAFPEGRYLKTLILEVVA